MDLSWVVILLALALLVGRVYHVFFHPSGAEYQARVEQLGEQNVIAAFQRRRRRGLWIAGVLVLAAFPLFYATAEWGGPIAAILAFAVGFVTLVWNYWCPVCGAVPLDAEGGLTLDPDACAKCGARLAPPPEEPAGLREQAAAGTVAPWRLAGPLRRVHLSAEANRLVLVKNEVPRLLELIFFLGICAIWWWFLIVQILLEPGPGWERVAMGLAALLPLTFGPYVYGLLVTVVAGDVFTFYRRTDRLVRNGRIVCALSEIDYVLLRPVRLPLARDTPFLALSLVLKSERRLRIDTSAWGDLPRVAAAIGAFLGVMVVTRAELDT